MNETGLLAHLRDRFYVPPENLATEVLAYILNTSDDARNEWNEVVSSVQPTLPELVEFDTQGIAGDDTGIPDLVGLAPGGARPFLAEVKFDAGLTRHQPVSYLRRLIDTKRDGLLLFIVPERRLDAVWSEVRRRSSDARDDLSFELGLDSKHTSGMISAAFGDSIRVGIITWQEVLLRLEHTLKKQPHSQSYWDLQQLRAMCARADGQAFAPFTSQDLESRVGKRILDLQHLHNDAVEDLVARQIATRGRPTVSWPWFGTFVSLSGWGWYFGVSWEDWAYQRPTPFWIQLNDSRARAYPPLADAIAPLRTRDPSRLLTSGGKPIVPIYLPEGVDRDQVRAVITRQIEELAELLKECPPPDGEEDQDSP